MSDEKIKVGFEGSNLELSYDGNADGQNSVKLVLSLSEVLAELKAGNPVELKSVVKLSMEGSKVVVKVDTDGDEEAVLLLEADLLEALDESGAL